jgi:negative regulator of sigma E activity
MQKNPEFETLSALADSQLDPQDLLAALDAIDANPDAAQEAHLYALIGDAMRDPDSAALSLNITASVMAAVASEPVPTRTPDAGSNVLSLPALRLKARLPLAVRAATSSLAGIAATVFVSAMVWSTNPASSDPQTANVLFEQPASAQKVVTMDSMPPEMVDYLLAHRQNSAAGSMNAGSAVIRANLGAETRTDRPAQPQPRSDMEWVRLWNGKPVYVSPTAVER